MHEDGDFYSELINAVKLDGGATAPSAAVWAEFSTWRPGTRPVAAKSNAMSPAVGMTAAKTAKNISSEPVPPALPASDVKKTTSAAVGTAENLMPDEAWRQLEGEAAGCSRCGLRAGCRQVVFGEGCRNAELMFIGEGPGAEEDAQGRPFVGPAGQLLDRMIAAMQYRRDEVYIANIVKCRPPGNRIPEPLEAVACSGYLNRQIELISPKVIVLLGATPLRYMLGISGIKMHRGQWFDYRGIPVMPTFHPAYLLRTEGDKRLAWNDLKMVMALLGKKRG